MAGARQQLQHSASAATGDFEISSSNVRHESPPPTVSGPAPLALRQNSNLFHHVYSGAGLAPIDRNGRVIPSLSTAQPPRPARQESEPPNDGPLAQFHDAMNVASLLPFPVGALFSVLDGIVYGGESAVDWVAGDYRKAGLGALGAGAGIAGVLGPEGRIPAKMVHAAAGKSDDLAHLIAHAKDVNSMEDRGFLITSLGDIVKKNGPEATAAIETLETIALRKSGDVLQKGAEDYHTHVREAAAMLVAADTRESNEAIQRILLESRGDNVRYHIINLLVNHPSNPSPLLKKCVLKCADDWTQEWAIQGLFTRALDDDAASTTLKALLEEAAPKQRQKILQYVYESFHSHMHLLEGGLQSFQPPSVRIKAAQGMLNAMQRLAWNRADTDWLRASLEKFRKAVEKDHAYSKIILEIDTILGVGPH